jgi:hypothetical protein
MNSGLVASTTAGGPVYSNNPLVEIGNTASTYVLDEAYPISVQSQELNWSGQDYLKLTVEFTYKSWRSEPLTAIFDTGSGVGSPF